MAKRRPDLARFNAALPAIKADLQTWRYADRRAIEFGDPTPLLALLDEIEHAYNAKRTGDASAPPIQQLAPAFRSLQRLRDFLALIDADAPHDDLTELCLHLVADTCVLFSPFLDGQPFQQALADLLAMPGIHKGREKGTSTTRDNAEEERGDVIDWAFPLLQRYPGRPSARAKSHWLAWQVKPEADGTLPHPFDAFDERLRQRHRGATLDARKRTQALALYIAATLRKLPQQK
jgi:hypothetical protein